MTRLALLAALVACDGSASDPCPSVPLSEITHLPGAIVSGTHVMGVSWTRQVGRGRPEIHGAIVEPDGSIGPDIALADDSSRGVAGRTTVLWMDRPSCTALGPFGLRLQRGAEVVHVDVAPMATGSATFDGTRYQVFWTTPNEMQHRWIAEDGTLGPVHTLAPFGACPDTASDGAGLTFLRVGSDGYVVDPDTGELRQVFEGGAFVTYRASFYFAGEFHVPDEDRLLSFPPSSTGAYTARSLAGHLLGATTFYPTTRALFAASRTDVVEVDADLALVRRWGPQTFDAGTFGDDLVRWEHAPLDPTALAPGRVELVRMTPAGEVWRTAVAVDSEVRTVDACGEQL